MSTRSASRDNALSIYKSQLENYAKNLSFQGNESLQEWSTRHAQRFTLVNNHVPLAVISRDLSEYVSKNAIRYRFEPLRESEGKAQFNKMLLKEFENWYSAFEAEADTASGWVYHSTKKLSRTGIPVEDLVPVVEAWLNEHLKTL